jgi:hypothetical protein
MAVQLKIRDMRSGKAQIAEFETVEDSLTWLAARPRFTEVLGPASTASIAAADEQRMRDALRPFDEQETAARVGQNQRDAAAIREVMAKEQARAQAQMEATIEHNRNADPNRPMHITWEQGKGCRNADPADERAVSEAARLAVEAWVAERNEWVHPRGKYLVDAQLMVWPGPVPSGDEADRVERGGQFNVLSGDPTDA